VNSSLVRRSSCGGRHSGPRQRCTTRRDSSGHVDFGMSLHHAPSCWSQLMQSILEYEYGLGCCKLLLTQCGPRLPGGQEQNPLTALACRPPSSRPQNAHHESSIAKITAFKRCELVANTHAVGGELCDERLSWTLFAHPHLIHASGTRDTRTRR
jgi:hypothetical protein